MMPATRIAGGDVMTASTIPSNAFGVVVDARSNWKPFLLGLIGVVDWEASAEATAITPGQSIGGGVMPVGIQDDTYDGLEQCPITDLNSCVDQNLTSGSLNIPGGFGWLKFGIQGNGGKCNWASSLGMLADGGCQTSKTFLDSQIGPPANSHGCCTAVGLPGSEDKIGSLTGNEWGDLSFYTDNRVPVWVPIWDTAGRHRRQRLLQHRRLRRHRLHRRQRARQVAGGRGRRRRLQARHGGGRYRVLHRARRRVHHRRDRRGPARPLAPRSGGGDRRASGHAAAHLRGTTAEDSR